MEPIMNLSHILSAAFLTSCLVVPSSLSFKAMEAPSGPIPPATKDITISARGDEPLSLFDVLSAVTEASGVELLADPESMIKLESSPSGFHGDFTIPASEAWTIVEHAITQGGLCLSALHMGDTRLVAVHMTEDERKMYSWKYSSVGVEELDYVALHPSFLFEMSLALSNLDTRTLSNQMRSFGRDHSNLQLVPFGSHSIVLRGVGREVESIARMLLETNERADESSVEVSAGSSGDQSAAEDC